MDRANVRKVIIGVLAGLAGALLVLTTDAEASPMVGPSTMMYGAEMQKNFVFETKAGQDCVYEGGFGALKGASIGLIGAGAATPPLAPIVFMGPVAGGGTMGCAKSLWDKVYYEDESLFEEGR